MRFRLKVPWCVIGNSMRSTFTYPSDPIPSCSEFTRHCRELHPSQSMSTTSDPAPFTFRSIFFPFLPNSRNSQRAKYTHYQYYFSEVISALAKTLQIFAAKRLQLRACVHKGMHDDLHWLNVPERIQYKIGVTVHRCLQSKVPKYRTDCCTPVSDIASRCCLRSASRHHLTVPSYLWSSSLLCCRPDGLELSTGQSPTPALSSSSFRQLLKTDLFNRYSTHSVR